MKNDVTILLVEDNPADADLVREVVEEKSLGSVNVVENGEDALLFLKRQGAFAKAPIPDYVLLDLNLPKVDGRDVLREVKADRRLRRIPIIVLTTSDADTDVSVSYDLNANCYIRKPSNFDDFVVVLEILNEFWAKTVRLPAREAKGAL